jgi:hypothetical protein
MKSNCPARGVFLAVCAVLASGCRTAEERAAVPPTAPAAASESAATAPAAEKAAGEVAATAPANASAEAPAAVAAPSPTEPVAAATAETPAATNSPAPNERSRRVRDDNIHKKRDVLSARPRNSFERELRARAAFDALSPDEQSEVIDAFEIECSQLGSFQRTLIDYALASSDRDAGMWPDLEDAPFFEPAVHADKQPIERKALSRDDPHFIAASDDILGRVPARDLESGWVYDYATREIRKLRTWRDPARIFANGLCGMPPEWDLAEALVERMLDDGAQQKACAAFAHAYTDRNGGVYPGITLYDAYVSGAEMEMPDVDCLGIIHEVLGDWDTWRSVVPETQHASLYAQIGELFQGAYRHRSLRHNLARVFLCGTTELRDNYQPNLDRFHALWDSVSSEPTVLAEKLPPSEGWAEFLQGWADETSRNPELFLKGVNRRFTLENDARAVRATLMRVLDENGVYKRLDASTSAGERR